MSFDNYWWDYARYIRYYHKDKDFAIKSVSNFILKRARFDFATSIELVNRYRNGESEEWNKRYILLNEVSPLDYTNAKTYRRLEKSSFNFPIVYFKNRRFFKPKGVYFQNTRDRVEEIYFPKTDDLFVPLEEFIQYCTIMDRNIKNLSSQEVKDYLIYIGLSEYGFKSIEVTLKSWNDYLNQPTTNRFFIGDILGNNLSDSKKYTIENIEYFNENNKEE